MTQPDDKPSHRKESGPGHGSGPGTKLGQGLGEEGQLGPDGSGRPEGLLDLGGVEEASPVASRGPVSMRARYAFLSSVFVAFLAWVVPRTTRPLVSYWSPPPNVAGLGVIDLVVPALGVLLVVMVASDKLVPLTREKVSLIFLVGALAILLDLLVVQPWRPGIDGMALWGEVEASNNTPWNATVPEGLVIRLHNPNPEDYDNVLVVVQMVPGVVLEPVQGLGREDLALNISTAAWTYYYSASVTAGRSVIQTFDYRPGINPDLFVEGSSSYEFVCNTTVRTKQGEQIAESGIHLLVSRLPQDAGRGSTE